MINLFWRGLKGRPADTQASAAAACRDRARRHPAGPLRARRRSAPARRIRRLRAPARRRPRPTPGSSVKEQIGANYASRLARHGLVALYLRPQPPGSRARDLCGRRICRPHRRTDHRIKAIAALDELARQPHREGRRRRAGEGQLAARTLWKTLPPLHHRRRHPAGRRVLTASPRPTASSSTQPPPPPQRRIAARLRRVASRRPAAQSAAAGDRRRPTRSTDQYETGMALWDMAPNPVDLHVVDGAGHYRDVLGAALRRPGRRTTAGVLRRAPVR